MWMLDTETPKLLRGLRAHDLEKQRKACENPTTFGLTCWARLARAATWAPTDHGFGAITPPPELKARNAMQQAWNDQGLRLLLVALARTDRELAERLEAIDALTVTAGPVRPGVFLDLSVLQGFSKLARLELVGLAYGGMLPELARLPSLTVLRLARCTLPSGLATLGLQPSLRSLRVACELDALGDCAGLSGLTSLAIEGSTGLRSLAPLAVMRELRSLDLTGCTSVTDVSVLTELPSLTRVVLEGTSVARNALPEGLSAEVVWSTRVAPAPTAPRQTVVPKGTPATRRKQLSSLRALIASRELDQFTHGIELLRALDEPTLWDVLLEGVWYAAPMHAYGLEWTVKRGVFNPAKPARAALSQCLPMLVGAAPEGSAKASALREKITALAPQPIGTPSTLDLAALRGLANLRTLYLPPAQRVLHPEALASLPIEWIECVHRAIDTGWLAHLPRTLKTLSGEHFSVDVMRLPDLAALTTVQVRSTQPPREIDLSGAPALQTVEVRQGPIEALRLHPAARVVSLHLHGAALRSVPTPCASVRELTLSSATAEIVRAAVEAMPEVETLDLSYCAIDDFGALAGLTSLKTLRLIGAKGADDLAPLAGLSSLEHIVIGWRWDDTALRYHYPQSIRRKIERE